MKKSKKIVIIATFLLIFGVFLFLTLKTTLVASLFACLSEKGTVRDYVKMEMMPKDYNFSSYKKMVVYEIRVDKAAERKAQRKKFIYGHLQNLSKKIEESYVYIEEVASKKENLEKYETYVKDLEVSSEEEYFKNMLSDIAESTYLYMSQDVYYPEHKREQVQALVENLYTDLKESVVTEKFILEPINASEYDEVPEVNLAELYSDDISQLQEDVGMEKYDYIAEIAINYIKEAETDENQYMTGFIMNDTEEDETVVLEEKIVAVVGESVFEIIEAKVSLPEKYRQIAATGSIRPYGEDEEEVCSLVAPVVTDLEGMQAKADEFVGLFEKIMSVYFSDEEALNELYENYFVTDEEEVTEDSTTDVSETQTIILEEAVNDNSQEQDTFAGETTTDTVSETEDIGTEEAESETEEKKYEDLLFAKIEETIHTEIESTYPYEKEWGPYLVLDQFSDAMQNGVSIMLTKRVLDEGKTELFGREVTESEKIQLNEKAKFLERIYKNTQEVKLIESAVLTPEEIVTILTASNSGIKGHQNGILRGLVSLKNSFEKGYMKWCSENVPECIAGGYFRYKIEGICEIEVNALNTTEGIYIAGIGIYWRDDQEVLDDQIINAYESANTVFMRKKAEEAISRDAYETEEEYEEAITEWLCENYSEYYSRNYSYSSGGGSYVYGPNVFEMIGAAANGVVDAWGEVGRATQGTLFGYFFTNNGIYDSFTSDVTGVVKDVVSGVKDFFRGFW